MRKILLLFVTAVYMLLGVVIKGDAMAGSKDIQLPAPRTKGTVSLEEAISRRRSERSFIGKRLSLEEISQLLWSAQGITAKKGGFSLRAAPSAGALYPMELYLLSEDGLFHYLPEGHKLEELGSKDLRRALADAALGQASVKDAAVDIVICAVPIRITRKYGERGIRYMDMEAGHIAQNIHLEAVALGLGSVPIGAFDDAQVNNLLGLPEECRALYIISVGRKKP